MKKVIALVVVMACAMSMMALDKPASLLNKIWYGMNQEQVAAVLNKPIRRSVLDNGDVLCVYSLYSDKSCVMSNLYYIIYRHDEAIERGTTNHDNTSMTALPFGQINEDGTVMPSQQTQDPNMKVVHIPSSYILKDKVFICNRSPYPVLKAIAVNSNDFNQIVGSCTLLNANDCVEVVDFPSNSLCLLRGRDIAVKVKGVKNNEILDITRFPIDQIPTDQITYDFLIYTEARNRDLYICIDAASPQGESVNPLDF